MIPFFLSLPIVLGAATSDPTPPAPAEIAPPEIAATPAPDAAEDATAASPDAAADAPAATAQQTGPEPGPAETQPEAAVEDAAAETGTGDTAAPATAAGDQSDAAPTDPGAGQGAGPAVAPEEPAADPAPQEPAADTAPGEPAADPAAEQSPAAAEDAMTDQPPGTAETGFPVSDAVWTLTDLDGAPFEGTATLVFFEPGQIAGQAPCNNFSGAISGTPDSLAIGPLAATRMACPDLETEQAFLAALTAMTAAEIGADRVVLSNAEGSTMTFVPETAETGDQAPE